MGCTVELLGTNGRQKPDRLVLRVCRGQPWLHPNMERWSRLCRGGGLLAGAGRGWSFIQRQQRALGAGRGLCWASSKASGCSGLGLYPELSMSRSGPGVYSRGLVSNGEGLEGVGAGSSQP